ncbi:zinc-ribbon domain-containing protein [Paenibacillus sp. J5C_2022]|uniref:zinc-ribbon domain-containing protein n=1 Tax=Paenibacillus sp. J5C2022 TaxID=2977129 RepID=UPI0021D36606|nr:zinc-ribbon domain-containing protein [Paenibacillus sp. J5C2022]MCU6713265.1 zinc-ribbon domain-containing protein [Paenibacillus sp. J5C2022]
MSILIKCRVCDKPVSSNARFCPHCGETSPEPIKERLLYGLLGLAVVGVVVLIVVGIINFIF